MKLSSLKALFILIALLFNSALFFAQDYSFKDYNWKVTNEPLTIPSQYINENEIIIDRTIKIEIVVNGNVAIQYRLLHEKTFINSDDAIERNNKIYISLNQNEKILKNKVRVILKNGKVILLDQNDIKEEIDEERGVKYNYFAINGLEKGALIERILVVEEDPELKGNSIRMQDEYPILTMNVDLIYPQHLKFIYKTYNGLSEPKIDTGKLPNKTILSLSDSIVKALDNDEKYSNWNANIKMFRYKLGSNLNSGAKNLYNFKEFSTNLFERLTAELNKKDQKIIDEFCNSIEKTNTLQDQIWNIENKIKKTIAYNRYIDSKESLSDILKTKQANQTDILKLYLALFKKFEIENNIVLTNDRYKIPFDKEFESYENLNDLLFYFPSIKKYLTPTEIEYRIPLIPNSLANTNGLFIKGKLFAGMTMGIGEVNFIDIPGTDITHDVMDITIDFTNDIENPQITSKINFGGYSALNFQPLKDFASTDEYKNILKSVAENYTVETEYKTLKAENEGTEYIGKKPFQLEVTFDGKEMIQKAGENYLFSVGQTIGRQLELYQENKRALPVEIDYPHSYLRKIKIILPEGTTVKNLEKFSMNHQMTIDNKTEAAFTSSFSKNGNEINVENIEYYHIVNYPLERFDEYKSIINAAADFNKIVIILSKK
jgi:hypothetical protein